MNTLEMLPGYDEYEGQGQIVAGSRYSHEPCHISETAAATACLIGTVLFGTVGVERATQSSTSRPAACLFEPLPVSLVFFLVFVAPILTPVAFI